VTRWLRGARGGAWSERALWGFTAVVFAFLFAPIVTTVLYAFNRGVLGRQTSTFTGFTTQWFAAAWDNTTLRSALSTSLRAAIFVALISTVIGTMTGITLVRHRGRWLRGTLEMLVYLLLIVPEIVLAVALLLWYTKLHVALGMVTLVAGHTPFTIALVSMIIRSRVVALDRRLEEAAADLGASRRRVLMDVIFPQLRPAIVACLILAFTFSFDDVVISFFLSTPTVTTLPVYLFGTVRLGTTPAAYAIAVIMLAFTLVMLSLAGLLYRHQVRRSGRARRRRGVARAGPGNPAAEAAAP
jgi:ABC-type spermidine/putrescine transport system permease subunit II